MSVKLRAALDAAQKFYHDVDVDSEKFVNRIAGMHVRRQDTFAKANRTLDGAVANLDEVDKMMSDLAATNGGPTLDDSKKSSDPLEKPAPETAQTQTVEQTVVIPAPSPAPAPVAQPEALQEPHASWGGEKAAAS